MDRSEPIFRDTLKCLLAFPAGLDALQAVLAARAARLSKAAAHAARDACYDPAMRPKALELIGRERENGFLMGELDDLRRSNR